MQRGRLMEAESLHCTLAYLGPLDQKQAQAAISAGDSIHAQAFDMPIDYVGFWPHNRIVWAGPRVSPPEVTALAALIADAVAASSLGYRPAALTQAHLTLLRNACAPRTPAPLALGLWRCNEFVLARSIAGNASGARYEIVARWPLAGGGD